jgi:hypothetical protein
MTDLAEQTDSLVGRTWAGDPADDAFTQPYVDVDEWRTTPVRHRYVHGGFRDADTRFSFYFPEPDAYEGRFFQHVTPVPQHEYLAQLGEGANKVSFACSSGGYFVETNGGGLAVIDPMAGIDPSIGAYRANAACARVSRMIAAVLFGEHRPYGYLYGGSGGGYRTIGSSENTEGVWDGFNPHVIGSPMAMPNVFTVRMHAMRILRDKFDEIVDAYDVGGDPDSLVLTDEQRNALTEVTRMGFPLRSWFSWRTMGMHAFSVLYPAIRMIDPTYFEDFWTLPGYLGADPASSIHPDRVRLATTITEVLTEEPTDDVTGGVDESYKATARPCMVAGVRIPEVPSGWLLGAELTIGSGGAAGATLRVLEVVGDVVRLEPGQDPTLLDALAVGDEVTLDNSNFLAAQTYHRHQVPPTGYPVWDQFRRVDGTPIHPQRQMVIGPMLTQGAAGTLPAGAIHGKVIVVSCLLDREAYAWQADWYRQQVVRHLGDASDESFRLWYIDNALHGDEGEQEFPTHTVEYLGALETALRQLVAWVEKGVEPSPTTTYEVVDGQVVVPDGAAARGGVQPTGVLTVNGSGSVRAKVGETVTVRVDADAPEPGVVVQVSLDLTGSGRLGDAIAVDPGRRVTYETQASFAMPGVYKLGARIVAQARGVASDEHARIHNILRARVEVL